MAPKKRRLQDLYITGREVALNDDAPDQEPIVVWLQKLNAVENETATRRANSARSRVLIALRDPESEEYENAYADVVDLSRDTLVEIAISDDMTRVTQAAQAEIAANEEWSKDDYLQGLRDAWFGLDKNDNGLRVVYEDGDESNELYGESKRVFNELRRYDSECTKRIEGDAEKLRRDLADAPIDTLREEAVKRNLGLRGDAAWITEYQRSQLFFGVRDPEDHKQKYFENRDDVNELHGVLLDRLYKEFNQLVVEASEGKDLPPTQGSSQPSEQSDEVETVASSGPTTVQA